MCGICGTAGLADERTIRAMTRVLRHRGPDGEGVRCFSSVDGSLPVALGHRRLSIIDPGPRGAQPMPYANERLWITYNGELYNFRELRAELERDGHRFTTGTDTEVLLAMYARYGEEMLARLNGIFAFAIFDRGRETLFLARDRLGVKPLYWTQQGEVLYFASEVKSLLAAGLSCRMRTDVLGDYLTLLWVPDPDTLFEGVYKLPPGHCATLADGRLSIRRYWDMTFGVEERSDADWAELLGEAVEQAVRRQMVSDVPLGSFLSGGIDSSAIVASMAGERKQVTTHTIGFSSDDLTHEIVPDDLRYARMVGRLFDTDYHEAVLRPDVVELLPKLVWHMDEPIADPACISTYLICAAARERMTVILSGMGGDELFAGYPRHLAARIGRWADAIPPRLRAAVRKQLEASLTLGPPGRMRGPRRNLMKLMRGIDAPPLERYLTYCSYYRRPELQRLLSAGYRGGRRDPLGRHRHYAQRMSDAGWLNQILYIDLKTFLPCLNLAYTDRMSMAASTEVRVPLLDDELVALSGRIPPRLKLNGFTRKYVFKRSMEGVLPHEVIWRRKAGFGAPIRSWLNGELRPMVDELLSAGTVARRGLFDAAEIQRLIAANRSGREDNALRIWALLTLEIWQQTFVDTPVATPASEAPLEVAA
jgi:asparagine synthase (glutamine-hydrolysing)